MLVLYLMINSVGSLKLKSWRHNSPNHAECCSNENTIPIFQCSNPLTLPFSIPIYFIQYLTGEGPRKLLYSP